MEVENNMDNKKIEEVIGWLVKEPNFGPAEQACITMLDMCKVRQISSKAADVLMSILVPAMEAAKVVVETRDEPVVVEADPMTEEEKETIDEEKSGEGELLFTGETVEPFDDNWLPTHAWVQDKRKKKK